ncbi:Predicted ABC-type ATPase [Dyadobacter soli]|uniref:Predicted ABC-type ATPase n=1 Tax=Dyadobacter soli TaxID=659014 RepID=A0A1G6XST6_9BACT|nr:zeta toxin family protein [Dyadobacter soli]SDD81264.1 Predicted ABC-type ATPase [Dyadobacter soli]
MPNLYIISGCNGAGKTTASYAILPEILDCREFVNADNIAAGISPFNVAAVAMEAGRIMLKRIDELLDQRTNFAIETTLSTKSYKLLVDRAHNLGYKVTLLYFWLSSPAVARERVAIRVSKGGHHIPDETVERRYYGGLRNLFDIYIPICDEWALVNSMGHPLKVIAEVSFASKPDVNDSETWQLLLENYGQS